MRPRTTLALAALAAGSLLLAACGDDDDATTSAGPAVTEDDGHGDGDGDGGGGGGHDEYSEVVEGARRIEVTAGKLSFDPEEITAEAGEDLAIVLSSTDMLHDFTIDELDAHVAAEGGEQAEGGVTVDEPGTYTYYCSVPGHRAAGMEGTLLVE